MLTVSTDYRKLFELQSYGRELVTVFKRRTEP